MTGHGDRQTGPKVARPPATAYSRFEKIAGSRCAAMGINIADYDERAAPFEHLLAGLRWSACAGRYTRLLLNKTAEVARKSAEAATRLFEAAVHSLLAARYVCARRYPAGQ